MQPNVTFDPFAGPAILKVIPIIPAQSEIWIACKLGGEDANRAYNESVSLILKGNLDRTGLEDALQKVIKRHEALRSTFSPDGRFMMVFEKVQIALYSQDVSSFKKSEKKNAIDEYLFDDANHIFDLEKGPLLKIGLLRLSEQEHQLIITAHHIICDGWSMGILLEELSVFYSSYVKGETLSINDPIPFSSYAEEEQEFMGDSKYIETEEYWIKQYEESVPTVNLPTDFPRPQNRTFKSNRLDFPLESDLVLDLKRVGVSSGSSLVVTLMAAFEVFLNQITGQSDIVLGLPAAGQAHSGKTQLIGHCVNLLPLRTKIEPNFSFSEYLKKRKTKILDAYEHQQFSFGQLLQKLAIARNPSKVPLVPITFNIDMGMDSAVNFHGLNHQLKSNPRAFETFEIFLNATGSEGALLMEWSYNASLFKPSTIEYMMASFKEVIQEIVTDPSTKIGNLLKVDDSAYSKLNDTQASYPELSLHELLSKQAEKTPSNLALKFKDSEISYKDLNQKIHQMAHGLVELGISKSDFVGVLLPRSTELVISLIAVMECGAAYLPLDPSFPSKRLEFMLKDSGAKYIITTKSLSSTLKSGVKYLYIEDIFQDLQKYPANPVSVKVHNKETAYLLYTSGSTGKPKGVKITHRNLVNLLYSVLENPGIRESDTLVSITTISFDIAAVELFAPLLKGAKLVLTRERVVKDTRLLLELIEKEKITVMQATPATWQMLLDAGWENHLPIRAISTGEALPLNLAKSILGRVKELWNLYGPTEATIWASIKEILPTDKIITIGKPIANTQMYIIGAQGNLLGPGQVGELCIAGDGVATGYLGRPNLTADKFLNNPFTNSESKLYKTGDLAKLLPSGDIQCLGRIDQQIKLRGYRIELGEIEQALNSLEDIHSSVVTLHEGRLIANVITVTQEVQNTKKEGVWKKTLSEQLPNYMVPHQFNLVDQFPTTPNGKIDRNALLDSIPKRIDKLDFIEPSTKSEKIIAGIWQECLKIEKIDVNSDFFELGGHSLIGNKAMALLEKETGKRIPLVALLKHSTIRKLATYMDKEFFNWDSLVPLKPKGSKPPLYIVHGANHHVLIFNELAQKLDKEQPVYGLQSRGLNGIAEPHASIDEMAKDYISEIVASNPEGPYALAGFSYGGIVAFEMARQLIAQGRKVKILAQFDTYVFPQYYFRNRLKKKVVSVLYFFGKIIFIIFNMFSSRKNFVRRLGLIKLQLEGLWLRLKYGREKQHEMQFNVRLKMQTNHNIATAKYTIAPQDIVVDLFRASEEVNLVHDHKFLGWKKIANRGIRKHAILGNHVDMFEKPHVEDFATILQNILDNHDSAKL